MLQMEQPRLILASASTSRRALLESARLRFVAVPAEVDEAAARQTAKAAGLGAPAAALALAELKATQVSRQHPDALVIGADQILACGVTWFDKPADLATARAHLDALRGRTHVLATAVVCCLHGRLQWRHVAQPRLTMRAFTDAFLDAYLAAEGAALTSTVGAYRLEAGGIQLFQRVTGAHDAILGLPLLPLLGFLRRRGVLLS